MQPRSSPPRLEIPCILVAALCFVPVPAALGANPVAHDAAFEIVGTLIRLPTSKACASATVRVTTRYEIDDVAAVPGLPPAGLREGATILVVHDCPLHPRGQARATSGNAGAMVVGDRHRMRLQRLAPAAHPTPTVEVVDPFDAELPRYRALVTDRAPFPPRMAITVNGSGTNHQLVFDQLRVSAGSSPDADVLLLDESVAPLHLLLVVAGDRIVVQPRHRADTTVDGKPVSAPLPITYRHRIAVGPYTLSVSLLTDPWYAPR